MRTRWVGALALLVAALARSVSADGLEEPRPNTVLVRIGAQYYAQYCASCHGTNGKGDGPVAVALQTPPADLTGIASRRGGQFPEDEISAYIDGRFAVSAHGPREMPIWGRRFARPIAAGVGPEETASGMVLILVEYLKFIQRIEAE